MRGGSCADDRGPQDESGSVLRVRLGRRSFRRFSKTKIIDLLLGNNRVFLSKDVRRRPTTWITFSNVTVATNKKLNAIEREAAAEHISSYGANEKEASVGGRKQWS